MNCRGVVLLILSVALTTAVEWDSIIRLTSNPEIQNLATSGRRSIEVDNTGNIWVVWVDYRSAPRQIWCRKFDRSSGMWLPETCLTNRLANCFPASIAGDGNGDVHLTWHISGDIGSGIWYKKYDANRRTWLEDTLLEPAVMPYTRFYPVLAAQPGGNRLHLVWFGTPDTGGTYQVFHKEFYPDSGWLPAEPVTSAICPHQAATLAVDSAGNLCVVWLGQDNGAPTDQVFCRRRIDGTWQDWELVSDLPASLTQYSPAVAAGTNGNFHITWHGRYGMLTYHQIFHRLRTPTGWSDIRTVSRGVNFQQESPALNCRQNGECHIVWRGKTENSPVYYQLIYSFRDRNGNWHNNEPVTSINADVTNPSLMCDVNNGLHVTWMDASSGNPDIYYLRGELAPVGVRENTPVISPNRRTSLTVSLAGIPDTIGAIYDPLGRVVPGTGRPLRSLPGGVYLVTFIRGERRELIKLVVPGKRK